MSAYERESEGIIHESRWAVTQKTGDKVYKIFLHDAYPKIKKEVSLLQLSLATNASLSFDKVMNHWVVKNFVRPSIVLSVSILTNQKLKRSLKWIRILSLCHQENVLLHLEKKEYAH